MLFLSEIGLKTNFNGIVEYKDIQSGFVYFIRMCRYLKHLNDNHRSRWWPKRVGMRKKKTKKTIYNYWLIFAYFGGFINVVFFLFLVKYAQISNGLKKIFEWNPAKQNIHRCDFTKLQFHAIFREINFKIDDEHFPSLQIRNH